MRRAQPARVRTPIRRRVLTRPVLVGALVIAAASVSGLSGQQSGTGDVAGTVVVEGTAAPIPFAHVELGTGSEAVTTVSDSAGRFRLDGIPADRHELRVSASGYEEHRIMLVVPEAGEVDVEIGLPAEAEPPDTTIVTGRVIDNRSSAPVANAVVRVEGTELMTVADTAGTYRIVGVPPGPQVLRASRLGYAPSRVSVRVPLDGVIRTEIRLGQTALEVPGINVTVDPAGRAEGELGTASVIDREAIEHQTASSLGDVLQLVPGVETAPPELGGVQQLSLRAVATGGRSPAFRARGDRTAETLASFGTLIILDGVPISNNSNLQSLGPRGELSFTTSAGGGVDLRQVPASTIERVEVIRGIPSSRYGDLTQGTIIVETRTGAVDPEAQARYDARTGEMSFVGGQAFAGGGHSGTLTLDVAETNAQAGVAGDASLRAAGKLAHRAEIGEAPGPSGAVPRLALDTRVEAFRLVTDLPEDENIRPGTSSRSENTGLRVTERAELRLDRDARLSFTGSLSTLWQESTSTARLTRTAMPFTDRLTEGRQEGFFLVGPYRSVAQVDGRPSLLFSRLEFEDRFRALGFEHRPRVGAVLRREWNSGQGFQFDIARPPQVNFNGVQGYDRPRSFEPVPALATTGLYVDDRLRSRVWDEGLLEVQVGIRIDLLHERGNPFGGVRDAALQPRLNLNLSPVPWLRLRGGAGTTVKAPSLETLHPAKQYYDVVNVNHFADDPGERFAVLTTFIEDPTNPDLGFIRSRKLEVGPEVALGGSVVSLTAFNDRITDGVGILPEPSHILRDRFALTDSVIGNGVRPEIITPPTGADTIPVLIDRPANFIEQTSRGLELVASFPELEALRTRLQMTGAYVETRRTLDGIFFGPRRNFSDFQLLESDERNPYWLGAEELGERAMLTYRLIHQQPEAGLVISATIQHNVHDEIRDASASDTLAFDGYVTRAGELVPVPDEAKGSMEFQDLRQTRSGVLDAPFSTPGDWMMNVQVSKSLPLDGRLNFWAFNLLDRRGVTGAGGDVLPRPYPSMRFGVELSVSPRGLWEGNGR